MAVAPRLGLYIVAKPGHVKSKAHTILCLLGPKECWKANCGYKFGNSEFDFVACLDEKQQRCHDCFKTSIRGKRQGKAN